MLIRPRRNRRNETIRSMVRENRVDLSDLIYPLFLSPGSGVKDEISSLPGNFRLSFENLSLEIEACMNLGLKSFVLFPVVPEKFKDVKGKYGYSSDNFYLKAIKTLKKRFPESCLISDVAMDPYSSDGHDGLVENGEILNDETLPILADYALAQAEHGIDIIGPSDMMDGRVEYLRDELDNAGFENVGIMSYTAKYASAFYGPFRDALDSAPKSGDKKTYQMDPANRNEAIREAMLDESEGADFLMVKPALHYLDIISDIKAETELPVAAYHVSGECAMLKAACEKGWMDFEKAMPETLLCIKRAGADVILTYFAKEFAELRKSGKI